MGEAAWLVVGLGNPGLAHAAARHNVGFRVVARLAAWAGAAFGDPVRGALWAPAVVGGRPAVLLQPQEFMNRSGPPVAAWLEALELGADHLVVIHDDLDLDLGRLKVATGGGDAGHRGIRSVAEAVGTPDFLRVRVGIGRPAGAEAAAHVLAAPPAAVAEVLRGAEARAAEAVQAILGEGPLAAMNRFNPWPAPPPGPGDAGPRGL